ncbi:hypothetical protein [Synechococcus phage S-N03]|uniref:Uncharacterized protein n=1 Tax=Synechococcus phage S-N03 TaxID=2718943 RepID=A0A6G8R5K9_9CAUD|nr:hypothetical protein PQC09_gp050 [Synechococcus phage S-N03]QIN96685.1 hypothetical protein [Synechococcus phage S-N03]
MNADIHTTTFKLQIWNSTARCLDLDKSEENIVWANQEKYMAKLMHRDGEMDY